MPPVLAVAYDNVPEDGHTTGFTFGLSSIDRPEWTHSQPELMISVESRDHAWVLCVGEIVRNYRHESLFSYGTILHFRRRIADDSSMTSFLVFAPLLLDASQQGIVLEDRILNLSQLYPIYEEETAIVHEIGIEKFFWELGIDFADVRRPPVARTKL